MIQPKFYISKTNNLPIYRIDPNHDFYFVPYFVAKGASTVEDKLFYNSIYQARVFTGKNPILLQPLDWEKELQIWDVLQQKIVSEIPDNFNDSDLTKKQRFLYKRNVQIGTFFIGKILNYKLKTEFVAKYGKYKEQRVESDLLIYFNQPWIWDTVNNKIKKEYAYLFFVADELSQQDVLFISSIQIFLDQWGKYFCHVVQFSSLGQKLQTFGKMLDAVISFCEPGGNPVLPQTAPVLIPIRAETEPLFFEPNQKNAQNELLFKELPGTKRMYLHIFFKNFRNGIKSIQIEVEGLAALIAINIFGRVKKDDNLVLSRPKPLFIHQFLPSKRSPLSPSTIRDELFFLWANAYAARQFWFKDWKDEYGFNFNPTARRETQGLIQTGNSQKWDDLLKQKSYPLAQNRSFEMAVNDKLTGRQNLAFHPTNQLYVDKLKPTKTGWQPENEWFVENLTTSQFLNLNSFLSDPIIFLDFGTIQIVNNKGLISSILGDVLGLGGALLGKFTSFFRKSALPITAGAAMINQIATKSMSWMPDYLFTNAKLLTPKIAFNALVSKRVCDFLKTALPAKTFQNAYIPLDFFMYGKKNQFSQILNTDSTYSAFHFELTDQFFDQHNQQKNTLQLLNGTAKIPSTVFKTNKSNSSFSIDFLELKMIGARNLNITFYDQIGNQIAYYRLQNQAAFSGQIKEITTRLAFSSYNDFETSNNDKFIGQVLNVFEKTRYSLETIENLIIADFIKAFSEIIKNSNFETKTLLVVDFEKSKQIDLNFEIDFATKTNADFWALLKNAKIVNAKAFLQTNWKVLNLQCQFFWQKKAAKSIQPFHNWKYLFDFWYQKTPTSPVARAFNIKKVFDVKENVEILSEKINLTQQINWNNLQVWQKQLSFNSKIMNLEIRQKKTEGIYFAGSNIESQGTHSFKTSYEDFLVVKNKIFNISFVLKSQIVFDLNTQILKLKLSFENWQMSANNQWISDSLIIKIVNSELA